jgi:Cytochrome P450
MAVVQESMRLYPPIWSMSRGAIQSTQIGSYSVAKGDSIWICTNNIHHDPRWYSDPEDFRPDRLLEAHKRPKLSYLPLVLERGCASAKTLLLLRQSWPWPNSRPPSAFTQLPTSRSRRVPGSRYAQNSGIPIRLERR